MNCPRCGFRQAESPECTRCGIIIAKWQARQAADVPADERAAGASSPATRPPSEAAARAPVGAAGPNAQAPSQPWLMVPRATVRDACNSFARLLRAGIGTQESLRTLASGSDGALARALVAMGRSLDEGTTLSAAAAAQPAVFRAADVQALRAAERTGDLAPAFEAIAQRLDTTIELRRKLTKSAVYPGFVLLFSIVLTPLPSLVVGSGSAYAAGVLTNLGLIAALAFVVVFLLPRLVRTTSLGERLRRRAWSLPWPASVYRHSVRGTFCGVLATNLESGLNIYESMDTAAAVTGDPHAAEAAVATATALEAGEPLAESLGRTGLVPSGDLMILLSGERAGSLVGSLRALAETYAERTARGLRGLIAAASVMLTIIVFAWVAYSILDAYKQVSRSTGEIFEMIEREMPYNLR